MKFTMENAKDTILTQWSPVVVQSRNRVQLCDLMDCSMPGFPILHYLLEFVQIHVHWISDTIQPSHPLLPLSPRALDLSQHQFVCLFVCFSSELSCPIWWPNYWSFSSNICLYNEYSVLISFRIDWFDLSGVQGTLKSLLQHHNSP